MIFFIINFVDHSNFQTLEDILNIYFLQLTNHRNLKYSTNKQIYTLKIFEILRFLMP